MNPIHEMRLRDIVRHDVRHVAPDCRLGDAAQQMAQAGISSLLVMSDNRPIGILTEHDLVRLLRDHTDTARPIAEVMTHPVLTAPSDMNFGLAYTWIMNQHIRHLVVVDEQQNVVGIASENDFRRYLGFDVLRQLDHLDTVMDKELPILSPDAPLSQALDLMLRDHVPYVIITEARRPIGILTERDMPNLLLRHNTNTPLSLRDVMRSPVPTTSYYQSVSTIAARMQSEGLYYLAVVDDTQQMMGVVTLHHLLERITESLLKEQTQAEQASLARTIHQTTDKLDSIIEAAHLGFWELNLQTGELFYSENLRELTGQNAEQVPHNLQEWMARIHKDDLANVMLKFNAALYEEHLFDVEYRIPHPQEHWMWLQVRGKVIQHDTAGNASVAVGTAMDITPRKTLEAQSENERAILEKLAKNPPLPVFLNEVALCYEALFPGMLCSILLLDTDGKHLRHGAAPSLPTAYSHAIDGAQIGAVAGSCGTAAYTGKLVVVSDIDKDPTWDKYRSLANLHHLAACWSVPVFSTQGRVLGTFALYYHRPRSPQPLELTAIKRAAHFVALAIERNQSEQTLRKSEASLRTLVQTIPDLIWLKDLAGVYLACNPMFERFVGKKEVEIIGKTDYDLVDKALADFFRQHDQIALANKQPSTNEEWVTFADEQQRTLLQTIKTPMYDSEGKLIGVLGIAHDITPEREAQESLRRSKENLKRAQAVAETGSWTIDIPTGNIQWSTETYRIFGVSKGQPIDLANFFSYIHPNDRAMVEKAWGVALLGEDYDVEHRIVVNGQIRRVRERAQIETDATGKPLLGIGTVQDITERHKNKEHLLMLSLAEAIGQNPRILQSGKTPASTYQDMWVHLTAGRAWKGELINRRKDGSEYHESVMISPVRQADGQISNYLAIKEDITKLKRAEENIQLLANFDALTGLPNRALLNERVNHAISLTQRTHTPFAVLFLDLDHFKNINDNLGHRTGDNLLIELSNRLKTVIRKEDTLSRLGGDEFVFVLPDTDADGCAHVAEKLLETIAQSYHIEENDLVVTASIGIAMYPEDGNTFDILAQCADVAMYRAKQNGRNTFRFFTPDMQTHSARRLQLENSLHYALKRGQFYLHYQPQIAMQHGQVVGAEALLRWQHPELGMISPAEFIPIAEDSGQILQIGEWVLRTAVQQLKTWIASGLPPFTLAVNLSAVQFHHPHLPELVSGILEQAGLPPHLLELELTESVAMDDPAAAVAVMDNLHQRGIRMSIDDFGTGYSSLSYLKRFKVYKLKIDQSFVRHLTDDADDKAIVTAIINMANSLGFQTIAEGVETAGQLAFLRLQGCDEIQGYYFSKPLGVAEFEQFLRQNALDSGG